MSRRPDLAIFVPSMRGGGAERAMLKLATALAEDGVRLDLVLARAEGPYLSAVPDGVPVVDLGAPRVLAALPALARYLRRARPPVLLSTLDYANIVAVWARAVSGTRPRLVVNEQNTLSRVAAHAATRRGRLVPRLARSAYRRTDAVTAVSAGVADDLVRHVGVPREKVHVVHNPVVTPELLARAAEPLDDAWFAAGAPPVILAVGRLNRQKDYPTLLHAFAELRALRPARLLVLGEGPLRGELETRARDLGVADDVRLPGFVDNPFSRMRHCAAYAMSSLWEGLPTVLIEALACGARVVSTDCPSGPREILAEGRFGRLVPMSDPPALARALAATLDEGRAPPGPESWSPYELETVVARYRTLLFPGDAR